MAIKRCPSCGQTYTDEAINFCLNDGELLSYLTDDTPQTLFSGERQSPPFADDSAPTVLFNKPRVTNQTNWPTASPPATWQSQTPNYQNQQFGIANYPRSSDQTLPIASLILGIVSLSLVCCMGGIWLGIPAVIVGYMGMTNADKDPSRYGGRGLAIAGMVLGVVTFLTSIGYLIFAIIA